MDETSRGSLTDENGQLPWWDDEPKTERSGAFHRFACAVATLSAVAASKIESRAAAYEYVTRVSRGNSASNRRAWSVCRPRHRYATGDEGDRSGACVCGPSAVEHARPRGPTALPGETATGCREWEARGSAEERCGLRGRPSVDTGGRSIRWRQEGAHLLARPETRRDVSDRASGAGSNP